MPSRDERCHSVTDAFKEPYEKKSEWEEGAPISHPQTISLQPKQTEGITLRISLLALSLKYLRLDYAYIIQIPFNIILNL